MYIHKAGIFIGRIIIINAIITTYTLQIKNSSWSIGRVKRIDFSAAGYATEVLLMRILFLFTSYNTFIYSLLSEHLIKAVELRESKRAQFFSACVCEVMEFIKVRSEMCVFHYNLSLLSSLLCSSVRSNQDHNSYIPMRKVFFAECKEVILFFKSLLQSWMR